MSDVAGVEAPSEPSISSQNRGLKIAVVALAVLSFGLALVAASRSGGAADDEPAVRRAAGAFGTAILTYDYEDVAAWKRNVLKLSTGVFKKQFQSYSDGLGKIFVDTKNTSDVRDLTIYLNDVDDHAASAIVVVETVTGGVSGQGRSVTAYLQLDLVETGNGWLVDGLTNLNLGSAPAAPVTATTAPTSTTDATRR